MYKIKLNEFEGPLDLLLFFIKRDELDVYDIPISKIIKEFLEYLQYLKELDLEIAGEFIVMTAELMSIKVKMLLPPPEGIEEEEFDPRAELVKRLLEYKRYKEVSQIMEQLHDEQRLQHYRGNFKADEREGEEITTEDILQDATLFDLITAFKYAVDKMPRKFTHEVIRLNVSIDEQIDHIKSNFEKSSSISFLELILSMREKIRIVVTFLAILELVKSKFMIIEQSSNFDDILLTKI
ncbi:MAG: segregation/condensation protein A [Bacteroidetes bacterium]|nr:segregation/condensation protein A [Bacteroidota bacterium]